MIVAVLLGALAGAGACLVVLGIRPPRRTLQAAMARLHTPAPATREQANTGWARQWTEVATRLARLPGSAGASVRRDLAMVSRTPEQHARDKLTYAVVLGGLALGCGAVWTAAGVPVPLPMLLLVVVLCAAGGFVGPDVSLRRTTAARRREFRQTVAAWLDLICAAMAGGAHTNEAVYAAAAMGQSPSFTMLRQPLEQARRANISLWRALGTFAEERGLTDLSELTAALTLVEDDGAQVRTSLAARAQALRDHELADAQAEAETASERMSVPVVLMMAGFLVLIGYPAVSRVLSL